MKSQPYQRKLHQNWIFETFLMMNKSSVFSDLALKCYKYMHNTIGFMSFCFDFFKDENSVLWLIIILASCVLVKIFAVLFLMAVRENF